MNSTEILMSDVIFQCETLFPTHVIESIFTICVPNDPFLIGCLKHNAPTPCITHLSAPEWNSHAQTIQQMFPNRYSYCTDLGSVNIQSFSAMYINTPNVEHNQQILRQLFGNPAFSIVFTGKSSISSLQIPSHLTALPINSQHFVIFPSKEPLAISWFPNVHKEYNFNSSIVAIDSQTSEPSMIERKQTKRIISIRASISKFVQSDLVFCKDGQPFGQPIICNPTCREDMRFFVWKKQLYGSYTYISPYIAGVPTYQKLMVGKFSFTNDSIQLDQEIIPPFGYNLTETSKEANWIRTVEKNWTWWEAPNGNLHCVYMFSPLKILEFSALDQPPKEITHEADRGLLQGTIRGGACGVIWDGKVWCFTHTSQEGSSFNIGVVVLSHSDQPRVLGWNHTVVSSKDYWNCIFYTCGAVFSESDACWNLTGGVQDSASFILSIPHAELLKKIHWIKQV